MLRYTHGNLLEAGTEALVNTVNTVGISGKGIALMFKETYPENFRAYAAACKAGQLAPGGLFVTERHDMLGPRLIANFATKQHWRSPSRLEWIRHGLAALREEIAHRGIRSIAIPPLGAGNGGLDWHDVKPLIAEALADLDCEIVVYEPTPTYRNIVKRDGVEKLTPARAMMADMIRRYEVLGFDCSILEAQKLAWFLRGAMQRVDLPNNIADDFVAKIDVRDFGGESGASTSAIIIAVDGANYIINKGANDGVKVGDFLNTFHQLSTKDPTTGAMLATDVPDGSIEIISVSPASAVARKVTGSPIVKGVARS